MSLKKALKDAKRKRKKASSTRKKTASPFAETAFHFDEEGTVEMWFGYSSPESAANDSEANPTILCMACDINNENMAYFDERMPGRFKLGDWYVAAGNCEKKELHGPFEKMEDALEFSRVQYGANHFRFGGW